MLWVEEVLFEELASLNVSTIPWRSTEPLKDHVKYIYKYYIIAFPRNTIAFRRNNIAFSRNIISFSRNTYCIPSHYFCVLSKYYRNTNEIVFLVRSLTIVFRSFAISLYFVTSK